MALPWTRGTGRLSLSLAVCVALLAGPPVRGQSSHRRTPVVEAVQKVKDTVVSITSEKRSGSNARWPYDNEESAKARVSGMGTGVIIDGRGYILTNQHVVDKVAGIEVHLVDGTSYPARVVQQDVAMDLAMIKVDAGRPLPAIAIGTSSDLMVGETVITIGNAFGYENTTAAGIISALGRDVRLGDNQVYNNLIQTDAAINPGNSGGPLINIDGELIGINVAVRAGAQGIGFALPIDDVKKVAAEMMSTRRLAATWHGLVSAERLLGTIRTVVVSDVQAGSPAEVAGFRPGDHVVRVGDLRVTTPLDIERGLLDLRPGQPAEVVVRRSGQEQTLPLEVQPLPRQVPDATARIFRKLGMRVVPVPKEYVAGVSATFRGGLFVQDVSSGGAAERAAIQKGDILVGMKIGPHQWETIRPDNILFILDQHQASPKVDLQYYLVRRNEFVQGSLSLAEPVTASARR